MPRSLPTKVHELLIGESTVSESDMAKAAEITAEQGGDLADVLIKINALSREDLLSAMSRGLGIPPVDLARLRAGDDELRMVPQKLCQRYQVLPISTMGNRVTVAMVDPLNIAVIDDLRILTRRDISPVLADVEGMKEALARHFDRSATETIGEIMGDMTAAQMEMVTEVEEDLSSGDLLRSAEEAPVVKLTNLILSRGVKEGASDILIEALERSSRVRYRIDGVFHESLTPPKKMHNSIISRLKVMSELNIAERRLPQDGRFKLRIENRRVDFRLSIIPSSVGERAVLRILDQAAATLDIEKLGFSDEDKSRLLGAVDKPHGLVLVCGPTGSGKTTTLYSLLKYVDSPEKNLVTVEDPVEYEIKGVNQVSVNEDRGLTFGACLRSILRQDPDVILVGEIRDLETVDIAIKAALTGHMVLSTLHTNTAAGSIVRMVNMGMEPFLIASSVELVAGQRLLRRLCPDCKEAYTLEEGVARRYDLLASEGRPVTIYKPKGCSKCLGLGYHGRIAIVECMQMSPAIKDLIFRRAEETEIERKAKEEGMKTLRENGLENVRQGHTSLEEVLRTTIEDRETLD